MAKKNKKKKNSNNSGSNRTVAKKQVDNISQEQIEIIDQFESDEMPKEEIAEELLVETNEDAQLISDIKESGNVEQYIKSLHDKLIRVNAIKTKAQEIKEANIETQKDLEKQAQDLEKEKKDNNAKLDELRKELNIREKKLEEERLAIDNGEYSTIIKSLLDTLRKTEEDITKSTRDLVEDLGRKHTSYLSSMSELQDKKEKLMSELQGEKEKLNERALELDELQKDLELERKRLETIKSKSEKRIQAKLESEYTEQIEDLAFEKEQLSRERDQLRKRIKELEDFKYKLSSLFNTDNIDGMLNEQQELKESILELQHELETRHSDAEFQANLTTIDELQKKINELENKVNEERLSELRLGLHNADAFIYEINTYKAQIDASKARERSLQRTVNDLHETIKQLKDEEKVKESAFEQARKMDNDPELQTRTFSTRNPSSLKELVEFLQTFMAKKNSEPFFYDQKTIRTFLAGLNMSPLTILQGISGTGKTSLPREIAKALVSSDEYYLGKDENGNRKEPYRICAIQSGWRDNMDLIGFYNNFEKKYKETDFFKAIYIASQPKYRDVLFLIILDEMNLSHPEHYFADFLSMMEQSIDDRYIKIMADEDLLPKLINDRQMPLPRNVRFIGTANHDETTLDFAPKTYDRSNVITLEPTDKEIVELQMNDSKIQQNKYSIGYSWLVRNFEEAEENYKSFYEQFNNFINDSKLRKELRERGIGIGNRFDKQAKKFICVYMASTNGDKKFLAEAVDHLITSRLFRSLKNRYDLTKDNLAAFRDFYIELFKKVFGSEPTDGRNLLNYEIENKK